MASPVEIVVNTLRRNGIEHPNITAVACQVFSDLRVDGCNFYYDDDVADRMRWKMKDLVAEIKDALRGKLDDFESREFGTLNLTPADKKDDLVE